MKINMNRALLLMGGQREFHKHLTSYFPFDVDIRDVIEPNLFFGSNANSHYLAPGVIGNALYCPSGTNSVARSSLLEPNNRFSFTDGTNDKPYSFCGHFKIHSAGTTPGSLFGKNNQHASNQATSAEYMLTITSDLQYIDYYKYSEGSNSNYIRYRITAPPIDNWFWLVIVDDAAGNVNIYIDNILQLKTTTTNGSGFVKFHDKSIDNRVGFGNGLGTPSNSRYIEYGLDDFGVFNGYNLTQDDRDYIWNNGNPRRLRNLQ